MCVPTVFNDTQHTAVAGPYISLFKRFDMIEKIVE